jgi:hypothetical protein
MKSHFAAGLLALTIFSGCGNESSELERGEAGPADAVADVGGDFHLTSSASDAIDQGTVVADAGFDLDGRTHDEGAPDLGADEYTP